MATQQFLQRFQRPPSPTLSNVDDILPLPDHGSAARLQSDIPAFRQRPPSPSHLLRKVRATPETRTPPLSRSSSNLDHHEELDATPKRSDYLSNGLLPGSSPTLHEPEKLHANSFGASPNTKRWSNTSSSVHSDDFESLESLKWPGFDSGADADADEDDGIELIDEDEEEQFGSFPDAASGTDARSGDSARRRSEDDDDPYSPNALSRRADMILANAKKRLNLFQGNLNSARHSLPVAQSMSMASLRAPPDMPSLPTPPRENVNYAGLAGPVDSSNSGHSRGFSEASASSFIQQLLIARQHRKTQPKPQPPQRSASALATHTQQNNHVRNSRSQELMREHRIKSWVFADAQESLASPALSENAISREDIRRSPSTTNDLRAQMNELKGKISSLQQRAKDENLRRRSYASLRSQSAASFRNGSPLTKEMSRSQSSLREYSSETARSLDNADAYAANMPGSYTESQYEEDEEALQQIDNESPAARAMLNETLSELESESVYESADDESVYESVFEDENGGSAARHEDRPDAFDYENFFLHSAMGSYTRDRSGSVSSEDSVETTKPAASAVPAIETDEVFEEQESKNSTPLHKRHASMESISTLATFRTATEGGSDSDEESDGNATLDGALLGIKPLPQLSVLSQAYQRDSGVALSPVREHIKPALAASLAASGAKEDLGHLGLLLSPNGVSIAGRAITLQPHDQVLVRGLAMSLERICMSLRDTEGGQYEGKLLRRRLDEARRVLDRADDTLVADS